MNKKHEELLADYLTGSVTPEQKLELEHLLASGEIDALEFRAIEELNENLGGLPKAEPSHSLNERFYTMLESEKILIEPKSPSLLTRLKEFFASITVPQLAYTFVVLIAGMFVGNGFSGSDKRLDQLTSELQNVREMMMVSMLEGASTTDRLRAVNISAELPMADDRAVNALLFTLNNDESVNVRVQSVEALVRWGDNASVREGLVKSIMNQESDVVIVALADAMVELELNASKGQFEQLLKNREMDISVKQKLQNSIAVL